MKIRTNPFTIETKYFYFYIDNCFHLQFSKCGYSDDRPNISIGLIFFCLTLYLPFHNKKWADECCPPMYGIAIHGNGLWLYLGGKGNLNGGNITKCWWLPFFYKECIRSSVLLKGREWEHSTKNSKKDFWEDEWNEKKMIAEYIFTDFDGEKIPIEITQEEREWRPKWLTWTDKFATVLRFVNVRFSKEAGEGKGTYKGGVIEITFLMLENESIYDTIHRIEKLGV